MKEIVRTLAIATLLTLSLTGWSTKQTHELANDVLVEIGDWCSGVVVDKAKGWVATAQHCTKQFHDTGPQILTRRVHNSQGEVVIEHRFVASLVGSAYFKDVAILKISTNLENLSGEVKIAKVKVSFGDKVYSMGNPLYGYAVVASGEVTHPKGIVGPMTTDMILHTAYMSQGSSGGALLNDSGELVGLTNWADTVNMLASPVENLVKLMDELKLKGDLK